MQRAHQRPAAPIAAGAWQRAAAGGHDDGARTQAAAGVFDDEPVGIRGELEDARLGVDLDRELLAACQQRAQDGARAVGDREQLARRLLLQLDAE